MSGEREIEKIDIVIKVISAHCTFVEYVGNNRKM